MTKPIKILFLAANPKDTPELRLDQEIRSIDQALRSARFREVFDIRQQWAVRVDDLQDAFLRHQPDIVHFSGHGSASSEIILEDMYGKGRPVPAKALGRLFQVLKGDIKCVLLNACYSEPQAHAIAEHIDCVIGMSSEIRSQSAAVFSAAFYRALGFGQSVKSAFELGCVQLELQSLDEHTMPKLLAKHRDPHEIIFASDASLPPHIQGAGGEALRSGVTQEAGEPSREVPEEALTRKPETVDPARITVDTAPNLIELAEFETKWGNVVERLAFNQSGRLLATISTHQLLVWDVLSRSLQTTLVDDESAYMHDIAFHPRTDLLAVGTSDGLDLWDVGARARVRTLTVHPRSNTVDDVVFSPRGELVAAVICNQVTVWELGRWSEVVKLEIPSHLGDRDHGLAFSPDGRFLAYSCIDANVRVWSMLTRQEVAKLHLPSPEGYYSVEGIAFSPDGEHMAACNWNVTKVWHIDSWVETAQFGKGLRDVIFGPDGKLLVVALGNDVRFFDITTRRDVSPQFGPLGDVVQFSPDGRLLAADFGNGWRLWGLPD